MNPMPGEEYKGIVDYMFTGDDGNTVDGEISYTAEVVGSDGDIDNNGAGGFYGLKVIPDSLEAHFDELGAENSLAKLDDDFANEQIRPGGDEHEEALRIAQEDADEMFSQADIYIPMEAEQVSENKDEFDWKDSTPVADNFLRFIEFTNIKRKEEQRLTGGYNSSRLQPITTSLQLQDVWQDLYQDYANEINNNKDKEYFKKLTDNFRKQNNDKIPGKEEIIIPPQYEVQDNEKFILDFMFNRGFVHTKLMMKQIVDFWNGNSKQGSIASLELKTESVDMNEELRNLKKLAGLQEACNVCDQEEQPADDESVHFRKEKSSDKGSVSIEASADSMEEMKRLLALIGHDLPKEMSPSTDDEVDNGPDGEVMDQPVTISVSEPGDKPFDPYGNNKKALLNYLRDSYNSQ